MRRKPEGFLSHNQINLLQHGIVCQADLKAYSVHGIEACDSCPLISNGDPCVKLDNL